MYNLFGANNILLTRFLFLPIKKLLFFMQSKVSFSLKNIFITDYGIPHMLSGVGGAKVAVARI